MPNYFGNLCLQNIVVRNVFLKVSSCVLQFSFKNASFYSFLTAYHDIIMKSDAFDHPELSKLEFVAITEEMYAEYSLKENFPFMLLVYGLFQLPFDSKLPIKKDSHVLEQIYWQNLYFYILLFLVFFLFWAEKQRNNTPNVGR